MKSKFKTLLDAIFFASMAAVQISYFCTRVTYLGTSLLRTIELFAVLILALFALVAIISKKAKPMQKAIELLLLCVGVVSYLATSTTTISYLVLLMQVAHFYNFKKIIKCDLIVKTFIVLFLLLNSSLGLTETRDVLRAGILRESYGFSHPNALGYVLTIIYADIIYLSSGSKKYKIITTALLLIFIGINLKTDSRTSILALIVIFAIRMIPAKRNDKKGKKAIALCMIPILCLVFSLVTTALYIRRSQVAYSLNEMLSTRIQWQAYYYEKYPVTLMGEQMSFTYVNPLDNGYYRILYNFGFVGILVMLYTAIKSITEAERRSDSIALRILVLLAVYALSESIVFRAAVTPYWLIAFSEEENGI